MLEYVYVKLITGEDVLSYKVGETSTSLHLSKPIVIHQKLTLEGKIKASAAPYCGLAEKNVVEVFKTACVFSCEMKMDAKKYYESLADQHYQSVDEPINTSVDTKVSTKSINIDLNDSLEEPKEVVVKSKSTLH